MLSEPVLCLLIEGFISGVNDLGITRDQMACRQTEDTLSVQLVVTDIQITQFLKTFRLPCVDHRAVLPEKPVILNRFHVFIIFRGDAVADIICIRVVIKTIFPHGPFSLIHCFDDPVGSAPFRIGYAAEQMRSFIADNDLVIVNQYRHLLAQITEKQRPANSWYHMLVPHGALS